MNDFPNQNAFKAGNTRIASDAWTKLMQLADMLEINEAAGIITIRNGKSRIILRADGAVRIEGQSIVQSAERNIALDAAYIDLN